jgi:DNA-binding MarR family transcriptional regulator
MREGKNNGEEELASLELVLRLHREYRRNLEMIHVTPLQAMVLLFLRCHAESNVMGAAAVLRLTQPVVSEVIKDLVRKRLVTKRRSVSDTRAVCLSLSRQGNSLVRQIEQGVRQVNSSLTQLTRKTLGGMTKKDLRAQTLL